MQEMLSAPGTVFVHRDNGFALGRVIAGEAELLTLAVDPDDQGKGIGRACLQLFIAKCSAGGAERLHLEVAATNARAIGLYASEGFVQTGRRAGYYRLADGNRVDALLMTHPLDTPDPALPG